MIEMEVSQLNNIERIELNQHEAIIERGLQTFYEVGQSLIEIRTKKLYRDHYANFEVYCMERWGMIEKRASHFMEAAKVIDNLRSGTNVGTDVLLPINEAQARPLTQLPPAQQQQAWQTAVDTAPSGKVTGAHVQRVVDDFRGKATQLREEYKKQERETGNDLPLIFNVSDAALWDATPSVKQITLKLNDYRIWINKDFAVAVQMGKLSPEARGFIANKLRDIAADFSRKADELENDND
jgi:hypothetical protein